MSCCVCQKAKTSLVCGLCQQSVCKSCTEFLEPEQFKFMSPPPEECRHTTYCGPCFAEQVLPQKNRYDEILVDAQQVSVFDKTQKKETRLLSRKEPVLKVQDQRDYDEAILQLAFAAATKGFNAIIDLDLKSKKVINGRHQHLLWSGTAVPTQVSDKKLIKDRSTWSNPN